MYSHLIALNAAMMRLKLKEKQATKRSPTLNRVKFKKKSKVIRIKKKKKDRPGFDHHCWRTKRTSATNELRKYSTRY